MMSNLSLSYTGRKNSEWLSGLHHHDNNIMRLSQSWHTHDVLRSHQFKIVIGTHLELVYDEFLHCCNIMGWLVHTILMVVDGLDCLVRDPVCCTQETVCITHRKCLRAQSTKSDDVSHLLWQDVVLWSDVDKHTWTFISQHVAPPTTSWRPGLRWIQQLTIWTCARYQDHTSCMCVCVWEGGGWVRERGRDVNGCCGSIVAVIIEWVWLCLTQKCSSATLPMPINYITFYQQGRQLLWIRMCLYTHGSSCSFQGASPLGQQWSSPGSSSPPLRWGTSPAHRKA